MANKKRTGTSQAGTPIQRAARLSYQQLFLYLAVFLIGGVVLAVGLYTGALSEGAGSTTTAMGVASVILCAVGTVFFAAALMKKRRQNSGKLSK